jgi:CheY-like chemotaxis protein
MQLEVHVAANATEVDEVLDSDVPSLAIIDAEMPGRSGFDVVAAIKERLPACKVVLVVGRHIDAAQMRRVVECGCDEVLIAPVGSDQLYDVVAIQLGLPRRGSERFDLDLSVISSDGDRSIDGRVTNLSVDGARLVLPEPMGEGTELALTITPDDVDGDPIRVRATVVWAQTREDSTVAGARFEDVDDLLRAKLTRLIQWEIVEDTERTRIVLKDDFTEAAHFDALIPILHGQVVFDLSQVGYINSLGIEAWVEFLGKISDTRYDFIACSIPFVLQASTGIDVLGTGSVQSFYAPYRCRECDYEEERLLQTSVVLAAPDREPPSYACPNCKHSIQLDELAERYLAFLDAP